MVNGFMEGGPCPISNSEKKGFLCYLNIIRTLIGVYRVWGRVGRDDLEIADSDTGSL